MSFQIIPKYYSIINTQLFFIGILTFSKNNIDLEELFSSPISCLVSGGAGYFDLLSFSDYSKHTAKFVSDYSGVSYADATYVLKYNTEYPLSILDYAKAESQLLNNYKREILDSCEIGIKYKGYIQREQQMAEKIMRLENLLIPEGFDFDRVESLSIECRQKLKKYSPRTIAQASRISGVSPADVSVLLVYFGR